MSSEIVTEPTAIDQPDRRRWIALAVIVAAQFMVVLDVAIVNVALPSIRTDLHFSQESLQWVITAYSILFGGVLLLGGRLADLLGRRRLFMAGLALFTVSSLLDGLAWSEGSLIGFRALQGLGAALLSPAALSILTTTFREGRERNLALGIWGAASGSGGAIFSQFFLLTLYMQEVLHYSAIKTGVAYIGLTLSIIAFSAASQALVTRVGVRRVLPVGLALSTVALLLFARLPVHGHYFTDLFPAFIVSGIGLALAFVPMSIGALTGVRQADAGIASGLINTTQQIGGAIGVAAATTIATTFTTRYVDVHPGTTAFSDGALTHGFEIAFYVLAGVAALGAALAAPRLGPRARARRARRCLRGSPAGSPRSSAGGRPRGARYRPSRRCAGSRDRKSTRLNSSHQIISY